MSGKLKPTRRCHWVPQVYLKGFSVDKRKPPRIWRFSNQSGEAELKRIDKVAVRNHLYTVFDDQGLRNDDQETRLSELEKIFASSAWHELQTGFVDLSDLKIRKMVSVLAANLFVRNPSFFDLYTNIHSQFLEIFSGPHGLPGIIDLNGQRIKLDQSDWSEFKDKNTDHLKKSWFYILNNCGYIANIFLKMRWSVISADNPVFITSDHPITFTHPDLIFRGIKNSETTVIFPLSPTRVLHMDHLHSEPDNQYYAAQYNGAAINMLVWRNALEYMFTHRDPHCVCAEVLALEDIEEFRNVRRKVDFDRFKSI